MKMKIKVPKKRITLRPVNNPDYLGGLELTADYRQVKQILKEVFGKRPPPRR
jgi:hypothetical protein